MEKLALGKLAQFKRDIPRYDPNPGPSMRSTPPAVTVRVEGSMISDLRLLDERLPPLGGPPRSPSKALKASGASRAKRASNL